MIVVGYDENTSDTLVVLDITVSSESVFKSIPRQVVYIEKVSVDIFCKLARAQNRIDGILGKNARNKNARLAVLECLLDRQRDAAFSPRKNDYEIGSPIKEGRLAVAAFIVRDVDKDETDDGIDAKKAEEQ